MMVESRAGTLGRFAQTAEAIGATASKLAKVRALAGYLAELERGDLPLATRYFAGRVFASSDPRVLSVGGAALNVVLLGLSGVREEELAAAWRRHRDAGDCAFDVLAGSGHAGGGQLTLREVDAGLGAVAGSSTAAARGRALLELLRRATPLEARYLVKLIAGEMRIGLRDGLVEEAIGVAFSRDPTTVTRADMLIGDLGEVALLAADDRLAEAAPRLFSPLRYMLASPVVDADAAVRRLGGTVWVEDKYDGIRCQLHHGEERTALFSRDLRDVTVQFPEVVEAARALPPGLVIDGEILAFRDGRVAPFAALQRRLGRVSPSAAIRAEVPVIHVAWDVLLEAGRSCLDQPLRERRRRLEALALGGSLATSHREDARGTAEIDRLFEDARARLNEGLMVKDPGSPYLPGRRGLYWLKIKRPLDTLDVVVVGAEWGHGRRRDVLSDVTFAVRVDGGDQLAPIGKAYTGLSDPEIREMTRLLLELTVAERGGFRSVRPEIVLEVAFDNVQASRRHGSGYALRFPRIVRWRHDKGPDDIDTLSRVGALAAPRSHQRRQLVDRVG